jgi:hypothetical protein
MAGPPKCFCIDKLQESDILQELYCNTDSEEELDGSHTLSEDSQESDSDSELEWREKVPTDKACSHQFMGQQSGLNKMAVPHLDENSCPLDFFLFFLSGYFL